MRNPIRIYGPARLAASAVAVAAVAAAAAGIVAAQGNAAPARKADKAFRHFRHPKLKDGLLTIRGTKGNDTIALRLQAGRPDILQVDVGNDGTADFAFERAEVARILVDAQAGDDTVSIEEKNGIFTDSIPTTIDGGDGNDTLSGGSGAELLLGGDGNDSIDGNRGNDVAFMGAGDDTFIWDPGDNSDTVEGQDGADTMQFNGANVAEHFDLSANGNRLRLTRDIGNVTMDAHGIERIDVNTLGGTDVATVNDLTGTDVTDVNVDLGAAGDELADRVAVNGTSGDDRINVRGDAGGVKVTGLAARVAVLHPEAATDSVDVNGLAGSNRVEIDGTDGIDRIALSGDASGVTATGLPALLTIHHQAGASDALAVEGLDGNDQLFAEALTAQPIALTLDGGRGDDIIGGSQGVDTLLGGDGIDLIDGNRGNDVAFMGDGNDEFVWDPGDGSDTIEGQGGLDTMQFEGANIDERFDLSANGSRLRFFRNIGSVTMDTAGVERVDLDALGGADLVTVNDLTGTDVNDVNVDLAGSAGGGDGSADRVVVNGTNGNDAINVNGDAGGVKVSGLAATVEVFSPEAANDRLEVNTQAGSDVVNSIGLAPGTLQLFVNGAPAP